MKNIVISIIVFLGILSCQSPDPFSKSENQADDNTKYLSVGVFKGNGAGATSVIETIEALNIDKYILSFPVSAAEIMDGKLNHIDVLIFPGGSGSKQLNNLGKLGVQKIKDFVQNGKSVIGICAGAYMLCSTPGYPSLQIAGVKHLDRAHYARGRGLIEFKLNKTGEKIFPELKGKKQFIQYYDGPILQALDSSVVQLANYVSDIHPNPGTPENFTPGKLFMYHQKIGKGTIFAIGGHAESTPGMRWMIPRMARFVAGKELLTYDQKWVRPEINDKEILFYPETKKKEKAYFWQLFSDNPQEQLQAMDSLYALRSRPFVRWNIGLLRDDNPQVRARAAEIMELTEYTYAIDDLIKAKETEQDDQVRKTMKKALKVLQSCF